MDWHHESLGNPLNTAVTPTMGAKDFDRANFWSRLTNTLSSKYVSGLFNYYMYDQDKHVEKYFGPGHPNVMELQKDIDLMLTNTHFSLDEPTAHTPAVVPVGGLHIKDDDAKLPKV